MAVTYDALDRSLQECLSALPPDQPADLDVLMRRGLEWARSDSADEVEPLVARWLAGHHDPRELDAGCAFLKGFWMEHPPSSDDLRRALLELRGGHAALADERYRDLFVSTLCQAATRVSDPQLRDRLREKLRDVRARWGGELQRPVARTLDETLSQVTT